MAVANSRLEQEVDRQWRKHVPPTSGPSFRLGEKQKELYWDDRRFIAYIGGRGTGKSTAACMRILGMIQRGEIAPGGRILIIGPDYTQLMDGTVKTFDYWFDMAGLIIHKVNGNKPMRMLKGNIEVLCRSAMNPDQTRSKECQVVWLDEAAQMDEGMFTLTNANIRPTGIRTEDTIYQTIISSTPRGRNWLWRRFVNPETRFDDNQMGYYHMTTVEAEEQGIARANYVAELGYDAGSQMYRQEVLAEYVAWTGLVYNQDFHLFESAPKTMYVTGGIDLGTISPTAIVVAGITEAGAVYAWEKMYQSRADLSQVMKVAGEAHQEHGVKSWHVDNDILWKMLRNGGFNARPPNKTKDSAQFSVTRLNDLISRGMFHVHVDAHGLRSELASYEYKDKTSGDEVTFLDKVKPNQADHALDALRYAERPLSSWKAQQSYGREIGFSYGKA